jgi:hypothetical protein
MTAIQANPAQMLFVAFKYTVYGLLIVNIGLFFQEESAAIEQTFSQGLLLSEVIQGYAATIDTAAWVLLLLMFELETSVLSATTLSQPRVKLIFWLLRLFSYGFIGYAFYGYFTKMLFIHGISPFAVSDVCALVGHGFSVIDNLDQYPLLSLDNCSSLQSQMLFQLDNQGVIGTEQQWRAIQWLTIVDVINSITWILVVLVLEVDVRLQRRNRFHGTIVIGSKRVKIVLYSILFGAAIYWGFLGDLLDFWDAFMWLLAFFFIEMNIFNVLTRALSQ